MRFKFQWINTISTILMGRLSYYFINGTVILYITYNICFRMEIASYKIAIRRIRTRLGLDVPSTIKCFDAVYFHPPVEPA